MYSNKPATRTTQGLFGEDGGFSQPVAIKRILDDHLTIDLYLGPDEWAEIHGIKIFPPHISDDVEIYCGAMTFKARYTDAVRVRVRKDG
jgi:hypothetical protein